jgi:hypothetical protein
LTVFGDSRKARQATPHIRGREHASVFAFLNHNNTTNTLLPIPDRLVPTHYAASRQRGVEEEAQEEGWYVCLHNAFTYNNCFSFVVALVFIHFVYLNGNAPQTVTLTTLQRHCEGWLRLLQRH